MEVRFEDKCFDHHKQNGGESVPKLDCAVCLADRLNVLARKQGVNVADLISESEECFDVYAVRMDENEIPTIEKARVIGRDGKRYVIDKIFSGSPMTSYCYTKGKALVGSNQISECYSRGWYFYSFEDAFKRLDLHIEKHEKFAFEKMEEVAVMRARLDNIKQEMAT